MGIVIDTHAQLWTKEALATFPEPMLRTYREMFGDYLTPSLEETIEDMDKAGVAQSVVVAIDAETTIGYKLPNEMIADAVSQYPDRLIGFAGVDPRKGKIAVDELKNAVEELGMRGIKVMPHLHDVKPNDPMMYPIYEVAQRLSVPVLFHSGTQYHHGTRLRCCRPIDIDDVAVDFPDLPLIIAHFGWPWIGEALALAMRHPNVYINVAGRPAGDRVTAVPDHWVTVSMQRQATSRSVSISSRLMMKGGMRIITSPRGRRSTPWRRASMATFMPIRSPAG